MIQLKFIFSFILWIDLLHKITGLDCYHCSSFELLNYNPYNYTNTQQDAVLPILLRMRDPVCRQSNYITSDTTTQSYYPNNQNYNQNNYNRNSKPYIITCPPPLPGSLTKKPKCAVFEGTLYTRIQNKRYVLKTTSMDCKEVDINTPQKCYNRINELEDRVHFEKILYGKFSSHVSVQDYQGDMCICENKECQLISRAYTSTYSFAVMVTFAVISCLFNPFFKLSIF